MESTPKSHFKSRSQSQIPQSCAIEGLDNFIKNNDAYVIWWAWARRWGLLRSAVSTNPTTYERVLMFFDQIRKLSVHAGLSPQICINLLSFSMLPFWLASSQRTWTCICWLSGLLDVVARAGQPSDLLEKVPLNAFINLTLETNCRLQICWLEWGGILYKSPLEKMSLQENLRQPLTYREAQRDELEWSVCVCVFVCVCVCWDWRDNLMKGTFSEKETPLQASKGWQRWYNFVFEKQMRPMHLLLFFSHQFLSSSLQPHELQHIRLPCPSLSPWACRRSCPLSQWCHPAITSSVARFSFCLQTFPASEYFLMSWPFTSGSKNIGASDSASVLPMTIQG